jgi:anthranilate/para-aminobenzoate synthase component I
LTKEEVSINNGGGGNWGAGYSGDINQIKTIAATSTTASNETNILPSTNNTFNTTAASTSSSSNAKTKPPQEEIQHLHETVNGTNVENNNLKSDLQAANEEIARLESLLSVPVIDVDHPDLKETAVMPPTQVLEQSVQRKRQRPPEQSTEAVAEREHKKFKIKKEHLEKGVKDAKEAAEEANERLEDALCIICIDQPRTVMLLPCRHFNFCRGCVSESTHCFTCRTPIETKLEAFVS